MELCECGCLKEVSKEGNRFIVGHATRNKKAWNKGLTKETDERVKNYSESGKGKRPNVIPWNLGLTKEINEKIKIGGEKISKAKKGQNPWNYKLTKEIDERIKQYGKNECGENNPHWSGGDVDYWHRKAWKLFGKNYCENCGKSNEDELNTKGTRLSMHCFSRNYKIMLENNWMTVCQSCHTKIDAKSENRRRQSNG